MSDNGAKMRALLLKSVALQSKQKCTNCCQILTPLLCIVFTYLIKVIAGDALPVGAVTTVLVPVVPNQPDFFFSTKNYSGGFVHANHASCWYLVGLDEGVDPAFVGTNDGQTGSRTGLWGRVEQVKDIKHAIDPVYPYRTGQFDMPYFNFTGQTNPELYKIITVLNTNSVDFKNTT